jgi:hypothetical protein
MSTNYFKEDFEAKRRDVPKEYLNQIEWPIWKKAPFPSHHTYDWVTTGFLAMVYEFFGSTFGMLMPLKRLFSSV